jgi:hypothetical protein
MKNSTKIAFAVSTMFLLLSTTINAQSGGIYDDSFYYEKSGFFIGVGWLNGPTFEDYVNWANENYGGPSNSEGRLEDYGASFCLSIGLRSRFSRFFAFEVDFLTSSKKVNHTYTYASAEPLPVELDLTIGAISFSVPVIFHFTRGQRVIPFVAAGATVFPLRLDHRITYTDRHTKTAFAGNFAAGMDFKLMPQWWITARADWTFGKTNMPVSRTISPLTDDKYEMDLTTTFFQIGVMRGIY